MRLLLDEHLSPRLALWCAECRRLYAVPVTHVGLAGCGDATVWAYALAHDFVVVTTNARDLIRLLHADLHPGLIVLRESGLTRDEQWDRLEIVLDRLQQQPDPAGHMINKVIELRTAARLVIHSTGGRAS